MFSRSYLTALTGFINGSEVTVGTVLTERARLQRYS
jgi:hypothetical protein